MAVEQGARNTEGHAQQREEDVERAATCTKGIGKNGYLHLDHCCQTMRREAWKYEIATVVHVPQIMEDIVAGAHFTPREGEQERSAVQSVDILTERISKDLIGRLDQKNKTTLNEPCR